MNKSNFKLSSHSVGKITYVKNAANTKPKSVTMICKKVAFIKLNTL